VPDIGPVKGPLTPPESAHGGPSAPADAARPSTARRTFQDIFKTHLARAEGVPAERERELAAFVRERGGVEARAVHLVRTYSATERDEALYAVETDDGTLRVIRGRDGSLTLFE